MPNSLYKLTFTLSLSLFLTLLNTLIKRAYRLFSEYCSNRNPFNFSTNGPDRAKLSKRNSGDIMKIGILIVILCMTTTILAHTRSLLS